MKKFVLSMIVVPVLVAIFQETSALKCWRCSSDASSGAFCDDPFDETVITEKLRRWSYVDCRPPPESTGQIAVCKKQVQWINNVKVISRSCFWEDPQVPRDSCFNAETPSYIKTTFCQTCTTDGCNSMPDGHHEDYNSTLKCWRCSTNNATNPAFCDDPFDVTTITEQQRRWAYVECGALPPSKMTQTNQTLIPVCKKVIQLINNTERVLQRSCDWEDENAPQDSCKCNSMDTPTANIKMEVCKTCTTNGCNSSI